MKKYKYMSENKLDTFEYHDAYLNKVTIDKDRMIWEVQFINIRTDNEINTYPNDMCIKEAVIEFEDYKIDKMERKGWCSYDENHNITHQEPNFVYSPDDFENQLMEISPQDNFIIYEANHKQRENDNYQVNFLVELLTIDIKYKKAIVKWNEYEGKAWYTDFNK